MNIKKFMLLAFCIAGMQAWAMEPDNIDSQEWEEVDKLDLEWENIEQDKSYNTSDEEIVEVTHEAANDSIPCFMVADSKVQLSLSLSNLTKAVLALEANNSKDHKAAIEAYLMEGSIIAKKLINGDPEDLVVLVDAAKEDPEWYKNAVRSLIWFYYGIACYKKQFFVEGSFCIEDPKGCLFKFLTLENLGAYVRISSHLGDFKKLQQKAYQERVNTEGAITKPNMTQYGFDIEGLPAHMSTILIRPIAEKEGYIFVKPELHGTKNPHDLALHGLHYVFSRLRKLAPSYFGSDDAPDYRKERVPQEYIKAFNEILKLTQQFNLVKDLDLGPSLQEIDSHIKAYGIQIIYAYSNILRTAISPLNNHLGVTLLMNYASGEKSAEKEQLAQARAKTQNVMNKIDELIADITKNYDNIDKRIGREVIITKSEIDKIVSEEDIKSIIQS